MNESCFLRNRREFDASFIALCKMYERTHAYLTEVIRVRVDICDSHVSHASR